MHLRWSDVHDLFEAEEHCGQALPHLVVQFLSDPLPLSLLGVRVRGRCSHCVRPRAAQASR